MLQQLNLFEYFIVLSLSSFASLLLASVADLMSAYIIIEMQTLSFFVLATYKRDSAFSAEAGMKYFIAGSFMSGIFLFGSSFIYGALGTLNFSDLSILLSFTSNTNFENLHFIVIFGVLLVTFTLLFKISAAPFHFMSPDVYDGAPLASTVVFSVLPKIAIFTFFVRWLAALSNIYFDIQFIFIYVAIFSLIFGTFFAINQKRIKRLLVFSSIVQVGFMVAAFSQYSVFGMTSLFYFLVIYILSSILIWSNVSMLYTFSSLSNAYYSEKIGSAFLSSIANM